MTSAHSSPRWLCVALSLVLAGCGNSETPAPNGGAAEVPTAGPAAATDPGPPPAGQTEPPVAGTGTPEATGPESTPLDAGPSEAASDEPAEDGSADCGETAAQASAVELQVLDWKQIEQLIASHKGQVVVVDLWSTTCIPCRREFPNLVKLHRELGNQVACVSVSTDFDGIPSRPAESYRPQVMKFLTAQKATFDNVLCSLPAEELFNQLQIGSIPSVFVYDQSGRLAKRFTGPGDAEELTYAGQIRPFVERLLKAQ